MIRAIIVVGAFISLLACAAPAAEVVVKNDSLTDGSQAMVVGNFAPGEHAGVRLTSPCNGSIVAVQILWLSAFGSGTQTLQEAIHIYADAGFFPNPGTQLQLLEGPLLSPGALNEFREIDENHTPLNVPVFVGQNFYVTLEFYDETHIEIGDASVVRDLNGCQAQRNVLFSSGWINFCTYIAGDLVIRAVVNCQEPTGACCTIDGVCQSGVTQASCASNGAVWTQGVTCAQVSCVGRGACCRAGGCLKLTTEANCVAIGGVYAGNATDCGNNTCVTGACCAPDGSCTSTFPFQCTPPNGTYLGANTTCSPNNCPQPNGACCFDTFCLPDQTSQDCTGSGGVWQGPLTACSPNPCTIPSVCHGDCNCDGVIDWRDIDYLVAAQNDNQAAWEALFPGTPPCTFANVDASDDGHVDWRDIDPFVALMNTSCQ